MDQNTQGGRFARSIHFQNEQQRQRYIRDTEELARKHLALKKQWEQFAAATGAPRIKKAEMEAGNVMTGPDAQAFKQQQLEVERATHSYFAEHEDTLRAIGSGRLYQAEREFGVPVPAIARDNTPQAQGFQEVLKYEMYGPTDTQRVEMVVAEQELLYRKAKEDLKELAGKYAELEQSWKACTEEMKLDGFMNPEEVTEFKRFAEMQRDVEVATADYWKKHGWRHEQDAQAGVHADQGTSNEDRMVFPEIRNEDGSGVNKEAERLFRREIEAAVDQKRAERVEAKSFEAHGRADLQERSDEEDVHEERTEVKEMASERAQEARLDSTEHVSSKDRDMAVEHKNEVRSGLNFTPISEENKGWARNNAFQSEAMSKDGHHDWSRLDDRIRTADREERQEKAVEAPAKTAERREDHNTLAMRVAKQTEANKAAGDCKPTDAEKDLAEKTKQSVREIQQAREAARQQEVALQKRPEHAMAA